MKDAFRFTRKNSVCIISALLITLASLIAVIIISNRTFSSASSDLSGGLNYLDADEKSDPTTADEFFHEKKTQRLNTGLSKKELEALKDDVANDRVDVFSLFKDYVILGDSRVLGFSHYKFLSHSCILAGGGDTIQSVRERMNSIKKRNPTYIFICYGLNDAGRKNSKSPEDYADEVLGIIHELNDAFPDAFIYYSSTIWISDQVAINYPPWAKIYDYNISCKKMCEENGIRFIDNDLICMQLKEKKLWSGDGIHLNKSFYKLWAKNLYLATLEG